MSSRRPRSAEDSAPQATHSVDWLVVTASSESQAAGYREQLRKRQSGFKRFRKWLVCADPKGKRIGSGTATLLALRALGRKLGASNDRDVPRALKSQRVLMLHSGGDSRRLPAFAALGKLFTPLPESFGAPSIFDLVVADLTPLVRQGCVLVAAGDLFLDLSRPDGGFADRWQGDDSPHAQRQIRVVACAGDSATASRHGVFVIDARGRVTDNLQKPSPRQQKASRAIRADGSLLIDSGVVEIPAAACGRLLTVLGRSTIGDLPAVDLYTHLIMAGVPGSIAKYDHRLRASRIPPASGSAHVRLHAAMQRTGLSVVTAAASDFLHIGTTREYLAHASAARSNASIVESSRLAPGSKLDGANLVVGVPSSSPAIHLPRGIGMVCLPLRSALRNSWVCVAFGDGDDFKTSIDSGGTLCNASLATIRTAMTMSSATENSAWTARAWRPGTISETIRHALSVVRALRTRRELPPGTMSLSEAIRATDYAKLIEHRISCDEHRLSSGGAAKLLQSDAVGGAQLAMLAVTDAGRARIARDLIRAADDCARGSSSVLHAAKLAAAAHGLVKPSRLPMHTKLAELAAQRAIAAVSSAITMRSGHELPVPIAAIRRDQQVTVASPVRIDLAGGWSDTPPICLERGGAVLNMAITLDGALPITVTGKRRDDASIRITSLDLRKSCVIRNAGDLAALDSRSGWCAIPLAALRLLGCVPGTMSGRSSRTLHSYLERFGGGLDLTLCSGVPKGSGLGTSSILGAAVLACLSRLAGLTTAESSLMTQTSRLEQLMGTGGGWQDQAGCLRGGLKLVTSSPGLEQRVRITPLAPPAHWNRELRNRALVYYTGRRRLAADILQGVVMRYLSREHGVLATVESLKAGARAAAAAAEAGDFDVFADAVRSYWSLKRAMDPGVSTLEFESSIAPFRADLSAWELTGAGGGGFAFMIARNAAAAERVRIGLTRRPPNQFARLYEFAMHPTGLKISVT